MFIAISPIAVRTRKAFTKEYMTRDGTAEPSRETKFSGTHVDKGILFFSVQLTPSRIGNLTRLIHTLLYVMTIHAYIHTYTVCMCVCVFFIFILDIKFVGRTSRGHTGFLIHLLSAVRALIFLARRIQSFLSLVDREVEFCVLTI